VTDGPQLFDPVKFKQGQRDQWNNDAPAWERWSPILHGWLGHVSETMLALAELQPGNRCLDIAAGTGELSLRAAERIGPGGHVLATDLSDKMIQIVQQAATERQLHNVEARAMDGECRPLPADDFDALFCRFALHLMPEPSRVLAGWRRVLKPGGRAVAAVWSTPDANPWAGVTIAAIRRRARVPLRRVPGQSDLFSMGGGALEIGLRVAGFDRVEIHRLATPLRLASAQEFGALARFLFSGIDVMMARLPSAERELAWQEVDEAMRVFENGGGFEVPAEALVGVGVRTA
jgi:ubiquinone/menaquinone biosynthesis C-methylase UbiE